MKVLMSALACEPDKGSEPEVGYRALLAAAKKHEVWVLTNQANVPALHAALAAQSDGRAANVHLKGVEFGVEGDRFNRLGAPGHHWYYDRWQRKAATVAIRLHEQVHFDVAHHVTLASYWTRVGIAAVPTPLVLGPIGGAVDVPRRLVPELGIRGFAQEAARAAARFLFLRVPSIRKGQRSATITLAQNQATARHIKSPSPVSVLSNALSVNLDDMSLRGKRTNSVLFIGRLLPWKGPMLALRALRYVGDRSVVLHFCGDGPELARLAKAARRWGLSDRIRFEGWLKRRDLLELAAHAGAVIHPCLREEAGLSVAEALTLGTPLVFLDHGGPSEFVAQWRSSPSFAVAPGWPVATARALAASIERALEVAPPVLQQMRLPATSFDRAILDAYVSATRSY